MKNGPRDQLDRLRGLRQRISVLNDQLEENLKPFLHLSGLTFVHSPKAQGRLQEELDSDTVDVSTTATVLMAVGMRDANKTPKAGTFFADRSVQSIEKLYAKKWESAGLEDGNFFTTAIALRAAGFVQRPGGVSANDCLLHDNKSPSDLLKSAASEDPEGRKIDSKSAYPITPALAYWLFDAAQRLVVELEAEAWKKWVTWANHQFHVQFTNVASNDDATMDPIALAMSACLIAKIKNIAADPKVKGFPHGFEQRLPSREHLRTSISMLFEHQGTSGVWRKYFPLFIYPQGGAANHCFTFELLEAVLSEFGDEVIRTPDFLSKVEASLGWCEKNRVQYASEEGRVFLGWNSGSNLAGLQAGYPECWATAVVHMFLYKLNDVLSQAIADDILAEYGARRPKRKEAKDWDGLIKNELDVSGKPTTVQQILMDEIFAKWDKVEGADKRKRSALLFGPPGTSKTRFVKTFAKAVGWPCISIDPSHFLREGLENTYRRVDEVFADLMDVSNSVVFFDEMDPLVQERKEQSDILHQALTTVFLPKLAELYNRNRVIFFMATNHFRWFDSAIIRPGRFDFLLCVGPPSWTCKLAGNLSETLWERYGDATSRGQAAATLRSWMTGNAKVIEALDRFTVGELEALFDQIQQGGRLSDGLAQLTPAMFRKMVLSWGREYIILWKNNRKASDAYWEYFGTARARGDRSRSKRQ